MVRRSVLTHLTVDRDINGQRKLIDKAVGGNNDWANGAKGVPTLCQEPWVTFCLQSF